MGYSEFTLKQVKKDFNLTIIENKDITSDIKEIEISENLSATLNENVPLALAINTEKARSELIIINVLLELKKIFKNELSLFSGTEFNVDKQKNLNGFCDYIISNSPEQLFLNSPIITIVEAKNENIISGYGQCIAEMIASKIFNEQEGESTSVIYGVVTTGSIWKFLKLENNIVHIDLKEYHINNAVKIMGILSAMVKKNV
ncbi:Uncharacterized protein dnl_57680 [Desulfonema limicola]|uniref:Uncharacterized protein n=1 Tax=Desulfonema limicola TaxID=45656 RepID=A0A975GJ77_9BACT|nr:hypothetical protein [Desulfonema limicola]QTA83366.1 Uncharacterized protein dnl_57680 [Desulfonema limicola]